MGHSYSLDFRSNICVLIKRCEKAHMHFYSLSSVY